jgi:Cu2+-exporting ATPase
VLAALVQTNRHPVCGAIREELYATQIEPAPGGNPQEFPGLGLECCTEGCCWRLGRPGWAASDGVGENAQVLFSADGTVLAAFQFREYPRPDAREELAALCARGLELHVLSGDRPEKVAAMADQLGLPQTHCHANLTPEEKAATVGALDCDNTLYIGDGANDSLAFDAAWCTGTPAVERNLLEHKAHFYFLGRGLAGVRQVLEIGAQRRRAVRVVVAFAIAYNAFAVALSLFGKMSPLVAAVLMPASSLVSLGLAFRGMQTRLHP